MRMKKRILFALGVIVAMAAFTACSDDDEPSSKSCTCKEYDADTNSYIGSSNLDPGSFNQSSCSALAKHLNQFTIDTYVTCK